jgi:hypothetical protein
MAGMKKFTLRLLLFCLLPLPLLYGVNYIIETGLKKSRGYYFAEWNDILTGSINADVVVCGSSRAYVHVSPKILDSILGMKSYNLAMNGTIFMMEYDRFKIYLKHNKKPKYVIQTLDFGSVAETYELYAYQQFLPYLSDTDIVAMTKNYKGKFGFMDYYFPLYRYNNQGAVVAEGLKSFFGRGVKSTKYKGYEGQDVPWHPGFKEDVTGRPIAQPFIVKIDSNSKAKFFEYLELCKREGIKVILVFPPVYKPYVPLFVNRADILRIYDSAAQKYNLPLWYYLDDELSADKNMFYNSQHLKKKGAEIFTEKVAKRIKETVMQ